MSLWKLGLWLFSSRYQRQQRRVCLALAGVAVFYFFVVMPLRYLLM